MVPICAHGCEHRGFHDKAVLKPFVALFKIFISLKFLSVVDVELFNRAFFGPQWVGFIIFKFFHIMSPSLKILSVVSGIVKRFLPRFCALVIQSDPHLATAVGVTVFNEEEDAEFSRWAQSNWALKSRDFSPPGAGVTLQGGSREERGQDGRSVRTEAPDMLRTPLLALFYQRNTCL